MTTPADHLLAALNLVPEHLPAPASADLRKQARKHGVLEDLVRERVDDFAPGRFVEWNPADLLREARPPSSRPAE